MIADYLKLLFVSGLICLSGGFTLRLLADKNLIVKDNPQGQKNMASFGTKLTIMSSAILVIGIILMIIR